MKRKMFIMTVGLPASGKSTWAEQQILKCAPGQGIRVNRDLIRTMLHADRFGGRKTEKITVEARNQLLEIAFVSEAMLVISDDTNLDPKVQAELRALAESYGYHVEVKDFTDVPIKTCIERDLKRAKSVGQDVIQGMWNKYLSTPPVKYFLRPGLPEAILVDLDGTLAHMAYNPSTGTKRSPYDWHRVGEDALDTIVYDIVRAEFRRGTSIILMSGRDGSCGMQTEAWLETYDVPYHELHMRTAGDQRKDSIVKRELYDEHVRDKYNVRYVLDDRNQVVRMWRDELGLKVLQVADGDF